MINSIFFDELYKQFSWYDSVFTPIVKNCSTEFFFEGFEYKLASISTNMNVLSQNETFFVTKVKINSKNDVYIRISQEAIDVILDKLLGKNNKRFELTEVSELEARIITAFNDFLYESLAPNFTIEPNRRYNEILHLTYFVKSEISDTAAKFIISVPKDILTPKEIETNIQRFTDLDFAQSSYDSRSGLVRSAWRRDGERIIWDFELPNGVCAEVKMPDGTFKEFYGGTYTLEFT